MLHRSPTTSAVAAIEQLTCRCGYVAVSTSSDALLDAPFDAADPTTDKTLDDLVSKCNSLA